MRRFAVLVVALAPVLSSCGDDPPSSFQTSLDHACRQALEDGGQALSRIAQSTVPADDAQRRARRVLLRFARGGEAKVSDLIAVRDAGLPGCADVLAGR